MTEVFKFLSPFYQRVILFVCNVDGTIFFCFQKFVSIGLFEKLQKNNQGVFCNASWLEKHLIQLKTKTNLGLLLSYNVCVFESTIKDVHFSD